MKHYAILCGSAPDGFTQKKINEMHDFLTSEAGGFWAEKDIVIFPNGVSEAMLSFVLERLKTDKTEQILLYICTLSPVAESEKSVWLGGEEVRKSVIESVASTSSATGNWELASASSVAGNSGLVEPDETCVFNGGQVIYDCGGELVREEVAETSIFKMNLQNFRGSL